MGESTLDELRRMLGDLSEAEKEQARKDLNELRLKAKKMVFKANVTVRSLRSAADKLDRVWNDCRRADAMGTTSGIIGGVATVAGGIATLMSAGAAAPLLLVGMGFGGGAAGTKLGTGFVESSINSTEIKKAEKDLKETFDCINSVQKTVQLWLDRKEEARLLYIYCLAMHTLQFGDPVTKLLQQAISSVSSIPDVIWDAATKLFVEVSQSFSQAAVQAGAQAAGQAGKQAAEQVGAQAAGQAGAQAAVRAGGLIICFSIAFLVWDAIDLNFTIRAISENRGSEAASFLRGKADDLEEVLKEYKSELNN